MTPDRPPPRAATPMEGAALVEDALVSEIARRVRARGVRVSERLGVLATLGDGPVERLQRRRDDALDRLRAAAAALRREAI